MAEDLKVHWENVYAERGVDGVSWYQAEPTLSLEILDAADLSAGARVLDMGGGASPLAARLLARGFAVDVLDLSGKALALNRAALGADASRVRWVEADACAWEPETGVYDAWHDRAVFHFLTTPAQQDAYLERLRRGLKPGGHLILAAFAPEGPEKCSALPVQRWDVSGLHHRLGAAFNLVSSRKETHHTPWDSSQAFGWHHFVRVHA